jgi:hypothetical protein
MKNSVYLLPEVKKKKINAVAFSFHNLYNSNKSQTLLFFEYALDLAKANKKQQ